MLAAVTGTSLANDFVYGMTLGENAPGDRLPAAEPTATGLATSLLVFAAFAMLLVTSEYASGTIRSTFGAQPRRHVVLLSKAAVAAGCGLVVGAVAGAGTYTGARLLLGDLAAPDGLGVVDVTLRSATVLALSAVIAVGLGSVIRSSVGTLAVAVVLLLGLVALPASIAVWTPAGAVQRFLTGDAEYYPGWGGAGVLAVWAVAATAVAVVALRHRDA